MIVDTNNIIRARLLLSRLQEYDQQFFQDGHKPVDDDTYDTLYFELCDLLSQPAVASELNQDTMPLGGVNTGNKIKHPAPVLSLDKIKFDAPDYRVKLVKWHEQAGSQLVCVQHKLDGLSIVVYKRGSQPVFVTRGGGTAGEDVTCQFKSLPGVWAAAMRLQPGEAVRGEAIIPREYDDRRTTVTGVIRSRDVRACDEHVHFVAYELMDSRRYTMPELDKLRVLRDYGFETVPSTGYMTILDTIKYLNTECCKPDVRDQVYPVDGFVVKPRVCPNGKSNQHHQFGQIAVKFPPRTRVTIIREITFTEGKAGVMTPIAVIDPVTVNGAVYSRVSLGSWSSMQEAGYGPRAEVEFILANDVIPQLKAVITPGDIVVQPEGTIRRGRHLYKELYTPSATRLLSNVKTVFKWSLTPVVVQRLVQAGVTDPSCLIQHVHSYQSTLTAKQYQSLRASISRSLYEEYNIGHVLQAYDVPGFGTIVTCKLQGITTINSIPRSMLTKPQVNALDSLPEELITRMETFMQLLNKH